MFHIYGYDSLKKVTNTLQCKKKKKQMETGSSTSKMAQ